MFTGFFFRACCESILRGGPGDYKSPALPSSRFLVGGGGRDPSSTGFQPVGTPLSQKTICNNLILNIPLLPGRKVENAAIPQGFSKDKHYYSGLAVSNGKSVF